MLGDLWGFALDPLARELKQSPETFHDAYGVEATAWLIQTPMGLGLSRLADSILSLTIGVGSFAFATMGTHDPKLQRELHELAAHFLNRTVMTRPEDVAQIMQEMSALQTALATGNPTGIRTALVRSPEEVTTLVRTIMQQWEGMFGGGAAGAQPPQQARALEVEIAERGRQQQNPLVQLGAVERTRRRAIVQL